MKLSDTRDKRNKGTKLLPSHTTSADQQASDKGLGIESAQSWENWQKGRNYKYDDMRVVVVRLRATASKPRNEAPMVMSRECEEI